MGFELHGRTLGLVGMGYIGTLVAQLARAFGMTVIAHDPFLSAQTIQERGAQAVPLSELLAQSDVVSVQCHAVGRRWGCSTPAPYLFSMMTVWPDFSVMLCAMVRASTSLPVPGE